MVWGEVTGGCDGGGRERKLRDAWADRQHHARWVHLAFRVRVLG